MREHVSVPSVAARKRARGAPPIVMVTAYDTPFARIVDERRGRDPRRRFGREQRPRATRTRSQVDRARWPTTSPPSPGEPASARSSGTCRG